MFENQLGSLFKSWFTQIQQGNTNKKWQHKSKLAKQIQIGKKNILGQKKPGRKNFRTKKHFGQENCRKKYFWANKLLGLLFGQKISFEIFFFCKQNFQVAGGRWKVVVSRWQVVCGSTVGGLSATSC